jgi:hypothetical protein
VPSVSPTAAQRRAYRAISFVKLPGWRLTESRHFEGSFVSPNVYVLSPPPRSLSGPQANAQPR